MDFLVELWILESIYSMKGTANSSWLKLLFIMFLNQLIFSPEARGCIKTALNSLEAYSLSHKTVNTRENIWYVVSWPIRHEMKPQKVTAPPNCNMNWSWLDTKQQAGFFFQEKSTILLFSNTEIVLHMFQLVCK